MLLLWYTLVLRTGFETSFYIFENSEVKIVDIKNNTIRFITIELKPIPLILHEIIGLSSRF